MSTKQSIRINDGLAGLIDWAKEQPFFSNLQKLAMEAVCKYKNSYVVNEETAKFTTSGDEWFTLTHPVLVGMDPVEFREAMATHLIPKAKKWAEAQPKVDVIVPKSKEEILEEALVILAKRSEFLCDLCDILNPECFEKELCVKAQIKWAKEKAASR